MLTSSQAGKQRRAHRIFGDDGRTVIVAMDHGVAAGVGPPMASGLQPVMAGRPDAVLTSWPIARAGTSQLSDAALILRVDGGVTTIGDFGSHDRSALIVEPQIAAAMGADAVVVMATPGIADEHVSLGRLSELCGECESLGLLVMAEVVPGGFGMSVPWSTENIVQSSRIAVELGADIIKTICPPDQDGVTALMEEIPVPVVVLGGAKLETEDDVVELARRSVLAGGAGIAFGRNVWGSSDPANLIDRLMRAVHEDG